MRGGEVVESPLLCHVAIAIMQSIKHGQTEVHVNIYAYCCFPMEEKCRTEMLGPACGWGVGMGFYTILLNLNLVSNPVAVVGLKSLLLLFIQCSN